MLREFVGKVVSLKMKNTAVVSVENRHQHPLYKKMLKRDKKFKAEVGNLELLVGDLVLMVESRPLSRDKKWKVVKKIGT